MTNQLADSRIYRFKGYWKQVNNDKLVPFRYFIVDGGITYTPSFENGLEKLKLTYKIQVFGDIHFIKGDKIIINKDSYDELELKVYNIKPKYFEPNVLIADLIKPRIESIELLLQ